MRMLLRRSALVLLAVVGGWGVGRWGANVFDGVAARSERLSTVAAAPGDSAYAAATTRFTGVLSASAGPETVTAPPKTVLVALRARDVIDCEDLGRQLRELERMLAADIPVRVWTDRDSDPVVRAFLRRERVFADDVAAFDSPILIGERPLLTPAVAVIGASGVAAGVSHPRRFSNVRVRSFAEELREPLHKLINDGSVSGRSEVAPVTLSNSQSEEREP